MQGWGKLENCSNFQQDTDEGFRILPVALCVFYNKARPSEALLATLAMSQEQPG